MDLDANKDTKLQPEIQIDLTPRLDYPLDPNLSLPPQADPPPAEFTIKLTPSDFGHCETGGYSCGSGRNRISRFLRLG